MMKKCLAFALMLALLIMGAAAQAETPRIVLMCCYQQVGWGNSASARYLDEDGNLWAWEGEWTEFLSDEQNLAFLQEQKGARKLAELDWERLFELQSLIVSCEAQEMEVLPLSMCDYGTISYTALRYNADGEAELIPLALTGDDNRENREENAHALYLQMVELGIAIAADEFPPTPYEKQSLAAFCGYDEDIFENASVQRVDLDCEAGPELQELSKEESDSLLAWLKNMQVTGKKSCTASTSATIYVLVSPEGETIASFEFYKGDLANVNGTYTVESTEKA